MLRYQNLEQAYSLNIPKDKIECFTFNLGSETILTTFEPEKSAIPFPNAFTFFVWSTSVTRGICRMWLPVETICRRSWLRWGTAAPYAKNDVFQLYTQKHYAIIIFTRVCSKSNGVSKTTSGIRVNSDSEPSLALDFATNETVNFILEIVNMSRYNSKECI